MQYMKNRQLKRYKRVFLLSSLFLISLCSCKVSTGDDNPPKLTGIQITSQPTKVFYVYGEQLDLSGLEVSAVYDNGTITAIDDYTVSLNDGDELKDHGEQAVTITYQDFSTYFTITVLKRLNNLIIKETPVKTQYYVGEAIDYTGLKVIAQYSDDSEEEITDYALSVKSETILSEAKAYSISVAYQGLSKNFNVECLNNEANVIAVTLPEHQDIENLLTYDNGVFTAKSGFESYTWWLDSTTVSIETETYKLITKDLSDGYHTVMVVVKKSDGEKNSATATVRILREEI